MPHAATIRLQIESALAHKVPSALTPQPRMVRPVMGTGLESLDDLLQGGIPVGALSELTGPECSGRTSVVLSFIARITETNKVCAWIDVSNAFDPLSAAAVGIDLRKLLWVRCGTITAQTVSSSRRAKQYDSIEQGLKSADLLLQTGGFSAIVLDMASIAPEFVMRIELSTWHRYRMAAERTQSSILLLTQYPCAKSSSELLLRLLPTANIEDETTIFTGMKPHVEVVRRRFTQTESNVVPLRKSPQNANRANWQSSTTWAVQR